MVSDYNTGYNDGFQNGLRHAADLAKRYANGEATEEELRAASTAASAARVVAGAAARDAAWHARSVSAASAAASAAWAAAGAVSAADDYNEMKDKQEAELRRICEEGGGMKTIYIVEGSTGAYSDRYNWLVRAFIDKVKAVEFAEILNCAAKGLFDALDEAEICSYYMNEPKYSYIIDRFPDLKKDSRFMMDYTGTSYTVLTCELEG